MSVCKVLLVIGLVLLPAASTHAGIILNIFESGNDVVINFSGSANTSGLTFHSDGVSTHTVRPQGWSFGTSTTNVPTTRYTGITHPATYFYTGSVNLTPSSGSGDRLGIQQGALNLLVLPRNYTSGTQLSGTSTFNNATLQSLNFTPGTYITTWGSVANGNADSLIMNVGIAAVPEPSSMALLSVGAIGLAARRWHRRNSRVAQAPNKTDSNLAS